MTNSSYSQKSPKSFCCIRLCPSPVNKKQLEELNISQALNIFTYMLITRAELILQGSQCNFRHPPLIGKFGVCAARKPLEIFFSLMILGVCFSQVCDLKQMFKNFLQTLHSFSYLHSLVAFIIYKRLSVMLKG